MPRKRTPPHDGLALVGGTDVEKPAGQPRGMPNHPRALVGEFWHRKTALSIAAMLPDEERDVEIIMEGVRAFLDLRDR